MTHSAFRARARRYRRQAFLLALLIHVLFLLILVYGSELQMLAQEWLQPFTDRATERPLP